MDLLSLEFHYLSGCGACRLGAAGIRITRKPMSPQTCVHRTRLGVSAAEAFHT